MKLGAVVVLYRPSAEQLRAVAGLTQRFPAVQWVIADNSPGAAGAPAGWLGDYVVNHNRGGIAGAFNRGVAALRARGAEFVFTFDQDSQLPASFFADFTAFIEATGAELVCPDYVDVHSGSPARFPKLGRFGFSLRTARDARLGEEAVSAAISSGLGFSMALFDLVRGFREDYEIDLVDTAFCYAALRRGSGVRVNAAVRLEHAIGQRTPVRVGPFLRIAPTRHTPRRRYYLARNALDVARSMWPSYPSAALFELVRLGHELACVALAEPQRFAKLRAMALGFRDGALGRLGPAPRDL
jgi:rhamnosyltransferase